MSQPRSLARGLEMLFAVLLLPLATGYVCLFPKDCVPAASYPTPCCPPYKGSPCGASEGRGTCVPIPRSRAEPNIDVTQDDKKAFPSSYFSSRCECSGNFSGPNCGSCKYYHHGEKCDRKVPVVRPNILKMSPEARELFFAQLHYCKKLQDPDCYIMQTGDRFRTRGLTFNNCSYYDGWCYLHYYATKPVMQNNTEVYEMNPAHSSTGFLTWHRVYIMDLEKQMQKCLNNESFGMPFYDWRNDSTCKVCNNDFLGRNNAAGELDPATVFADWRVFCGGYGYGRTLCMMPDCVCERPKISCYAGHILGISLPTTADVDYCLSLPNLDTSPWSPSSQWSFRNTIEGWMDQNGERRVSNHNKVHVFCGGTMAEVPVSCSDPMFPLHHGMIDYIFDLWIIRYGAGPSSYPTSGFPGHRANDCMIPKLACFRHKDYLVPLSTLGVTFAP